MKNSPNTSRRRPQAPDSLLERIGYAAVGAFFCAAAGAVLFVTDAIHWHHVWGYNTVGHTFAGHLSTYLKVGAIGGAIVGFFFKDKVVDVAGRAASISIDDERECYEDSRRWQSSDLPGWLIVVVLLVVVAGIFFYVAAHH